MYYHFYSCVTVVYYRKTKIVKKKKNRPGCAGCAKSNWASQSLSSPLLLLHPAEDQPFIVAEQSRGSTTVNSIVAVSRGSTNQEGRVAFSFDGDDELAQTSDEAETRSNEQRPEVDGIRLSFAGVEANGNRNT
ncbi:hypothetical protein Dimus_001668 [Dionaea muscipula]